MTPLIRICLTTECQQLYHDLLIYTELVAAIKHNYISLHLIILFYDKKWIFYGVGLLLTRSGISAESANESVVTM